MLDSLIVPLFVTSDLPRRAELTGFGALLAETVRALGHEDAGYEASLTGKVFWLDRPVLPQQEPAAEVEPRFAGMLGHLTVSGAPGDARRIVADVRHAVETAVALRYGDVGAVPAVFAIRDRDVLERTPESALPIRSHAPAELVSAAV